MSAVVIAHVLSSFELGGQERVAFDLAREQRRAGQRVIAFSLAGLPEGPLAARFRELGVESQSVDKAPGFDPALPLKLASLLRREHVELVHTHNPRALVYGAPAARLAGAVVVHSKHGLNPDPTRRRLLRRAAASLVDAYVAVTPELAKVARDRHECDRARLRVVPNGIDLSRFGEARETRHRAREELEIPEGAWVVGTVGRLSPEKDQAMLIQALAPELGPLVRLVLVGDGPEDKALRARVERTGKQEWVHFTGVREDVPRLLAAFDVFALSSRTEGLPLALLEAMAAALPVVATRAGGVPDLIEHALTGCLVDSGDVLAFHDALVSLERDPERAREMGRMGRQRVLAGYSLERMARDYQSLYVELLAKKRSGILVGVRAR